MATSPDDRVKPVFAGDSKTVDEAVKGDEQIEGDHEEEYHADSKH